MKAITCRLPGIVLLALAAGYLVIATQIKISRFVLRTQVIDSRLFPFILGSLLALLALLLIFKPDEADKSAFEGRGFFYALLVLGSIVIYAFLILPLGYMVATSLLLIAQFMLLGSKPLYALMTAVLLSVALYFIFVFALDVPLPQGKVWPWIS